MAEISSLRTEQAKAEMWTHYGVHENDNPLLFLPTDIYKKFPFEALHTLPLGPAKHLLREEMPLLSKGQKAEILAILKAFHTSGFSVKLYGNVCYYYQSFCGRDFKAWVQMALFIIGPYLNDGELAVWKSFCKVFQIAYSKFFAPSLSDEWRCLCQTFVNTVKQHMPHLLQKQKVHLMLHLVECMHDFGPTSAFNAESTFDTYVRLIRSVTMKAAVFIKFVQHTLCGIAYKELYSDKGKYQPGTPRKVQNFIVHYKAIISQESCLINCGDYIELCSNYQQFTYGLLMAVFKTSSGAVLCLLQGFKPLCSADGDQRHNKYDCPLLELTRSVFTVPSESVRQDDILSQENKAKARARYKADPEKKKASVRDSYKADPELKKASVRDSYKVDPEKKASRYQEDVEENRAAKRQRYQEDLEENRAAKRQRYQEDLEENRAAKRQRYQEDLEENRAAKRQRYQDDVEENRAAKRQKYEDNSAAIKASERNRYWNDPAVRLAKRAAERKRYRRGHRTTTTTQSYFLYEPKSHALMEYNGGLEMLFLGIVSFKVK
eukprot:Em0012g306a